MKSFLSLATVAAVMAVGTVSAQGTTTTTTQDSLCEANYAANAAVIAKAQAAATAPARKKILQDAINANPANAVCLVDLALQMSLNIEPEAGPETFGETPNTTDGETPPAENPNQLNESSDTGSASPVVPVLPSSPAL